MRNVKKNDASLEPIGWQASNLLQKLGPNAWLGCGWTNLFETYHMLIKTGSSSSRIGMEKNIFETTTYLEGQPS